MKIIHTSDWHLGKSLFKQPLIEDQAYFINNFLLPLVKKESPDVVIISGDIFDRGIAPVEAISLFDGFIDSMAQLGIPLVVITGNHDSKERIAIGAKLLRSGGIYISSDISSVEAPIELTCGDEKAHIYTLPFFTQRQAEEYLGEDTDTYNTAYSKVIEKITPSIDDKYINILVAHCFVTGSSTSDSESPLYVGDSAQVDKKLFDCFDYTALGHLHAPQNVSEKVRYSGSPLKYSFDEEHQKKAVSIVTLTKDGVNIENIPVVTAKDVYTVSGKFDELVELGKEKPSNDYIHINLTDKYPVYMPVDRLREYFPNILSLSCEYITGSGAQRTESTITTKSTDMEIFTQFLSQICGVEPTEEETELFNLRLSESEAGGAV
ncbi:MAG: exonuclease SbcCD subunit D [Acutalibacteraceae bacterium]